MSWPNLLRRYDRQVPVTQRLATDADIDEILDVCAESLGWKDPSFDEAVFRWKHLDNAFGTSLMLVAEDTSGIVAVRAFMRWRFRRGDDILTAARPVDTATRPTARGQGLFRSLTEAGIEHLRDEGVDLLFNTPNSQSKPGYLKMGWEEVGRISFGVRFRSPMVLGRVARSRTAALKASIATPGLGVSVTEGLDSFAASPQAPKPERFTTDHDLDSLAWRYGVGPITYRWLPTGPDSALIVRVRSRGQARELVVADQVGPISASTKSALASAIRSSESDYCIAAKGFPSTVASGTFGPTLTMRECASTPDPSDHYWLPGDIELF